LLDDEASALHGSTLALTAGRLRTILRPRHAGTGGR
jgi:hypothetical protein